MAVQSGKCKHCGKKKTEHKYRTFECPIGQKTRIGYIGYSSTKRYEEDK